MSYTLISRSLRMAAIAAALTYGFLVVLSVHEVSAAQDARESARQVTSDLGALEVSYYTLTHDLDLATVEHYGFKEATSWTFVSAGGDAPSVAINTQGARKEF